MATIFCDPALTTGDNDGTSWEDAYQTLAAACNGAGGSDEIWAKAGTFSYSVIVSLGADDLYGGFSRSLTGTDGDKSERDLVNDITYIDTSNACGAIQTSGSGWVVSGIRFKNCGNATDGGAIYASANGTLQQCYFNDCSVVTGYDGGAIKLNSASITSMTITQCYFDNCTCQSAATDVGGAINIEGCSGVAISSCTFNECDAYAGGSICTSSTVTGLTVSDCDFTGGDATYGGQIALYGDSGTFSRCTFDDGSSAWGGALYVNDSLSPHWIFQACLFKNCASSGYGGAIYASTDTIYFNRCTIADCTATTANGALSRASATVYIYNSIIWDCGSTPVNSGCTVQRSDVEGGYTGTGNINVDPQFAGSNHFWPYYPNASTGCIDSADSALTGYPTTDINSIDEWDDPNSSNYDATYGDMGCHEFTGVVIPGTMPSDHYRLDCVTNTEYPMRFFIPMISHVSPTLWTTPYASGTRMRFKAGSEIVCEDDSEITEHWHQDIMVGGGRQVVRTSTDVASPSWTEDFDSIYQSESSYLGIFFGPPEGIEIAPEKYSTQYPPAATVMMYEVKADLGYGDDGLVYNVFIEEYPRAMESFDDGDIDATIATGATNVFDPDAPFSAYQIRELERFLNRVIHDARTIVCVPVYGESSFPVTVV